MGPFAVAANGSSVQTATGPSSLLSVQNPMTKLDTTNQNSFQTIQLLFNHEPPQSGITAPYFTSTLVYRFKHGYTYIPRIWMLWQNPSPADPAPYGTAFSAYGDDTVSYAVIRGGAGSLALNTQASSLTAADLAVVVDNTWVNFYCVKTTLEYSGGSATPIYLIGVFLNIRIYVFTEPATTTAY